MVYDQNPEITTQVKKPRKEIEGKLISLNTDSSKCKIYNPDTGVYSWLRISLVVGKDGDGNDKYFNTTAYNVNFEKMKELKKADELLKDRKKPKVKLEYYTTEVPAVDEEGKKIMIEKEEERGDKTVIVEKQKIWINHRCSREDIINTFKILEEDVQDKENVKDKEDDKENKENIIIPVVDI